MYPSDKDVSFGIFVKNFEVNLLEQGFRIDNKALIIGKSGTFIKKIFNYSVFFYKILRIGFLDSYDLAYVHFLNHTALPVWFLMILRKKPLIINAHGGDIFPQSSFGKLIHFFSHLLVRKANLVVVPSNFLKKQIKLKYEIEGEKIFYFSFLRSKSFNV